MGGGRWRRRSIALVRLVLLLAILVALWVYNDPSLIRIAPDPGKPEMVSERFIPCDSGVRAFACVVDGDSFHLGKRKIRIRGIDAPEREGSCAAEGELSRNSRLKLIELLNRGPFVMTATSGDARDKYGRELRTLTRGGQSIGEAMVAAGMAHDYRGKKLSWCA